MKSKCQSCQTLSRRKSSTRSFSKQRSLEIYTPRSPKPKLKVIRKKYEIIQDPIHQSLKSSQRKVKNIQEKYKMLKDHVNKRQQSLLKQMGSSSSVIATLRQQLKQKQILILKLYKGIREQQQTSLNLSVDLVRTKNQLNVVRKENDFYLQNQHEFQKYKKSVQERQKQFRGIEVAFKLMQQEVLVLNKMVQQL